MTRYQVTIGPPGQLKRRIDSLIAYFVFAAAGGLIGALLRWLIL